MAFYFLALIISLFCSANLYSGSYVPKSKPEVKKFIDIVKSTEQMKSMEDKIDTLNFVLKEIDFKKSCTCIKREFFAVLNEICDNALNAEIGDVKKLSSFLKNFEKNTASGFYKKILNALSWILNGRQGEAPKYIKHLTICDYQKKSGSKVFIALGDCPRNTMSSLSKFVRNTYIITSDSKFFQAEKDKLKRSRNTKLILGDYEKNLPEIIKKVGSGALFWISCTNINKTLSELDYLLKHNKKFTILIDKSHLFSKDSLKELTALIKHKSAKINVKVKDDIIRIS